MSSYKHNNRRPKESREVHLGFLSRKDAMAYARHQRQHRAPGTRCRTHVYKSGFEYCVNVVRY